MFKLQKYFYKNPSRPKLTCSEFSSDFKGIYEDINKSFNSLNTGKYIKFINFGFSNLKNISENYLNML